MGIGFDMMKRKDKTNTPFKDRSDSCFNCGRSLNMDIRLRLLECVFAVNPLSYEDFKVNPSICTHCLGEICAILNYDILSPNDDLLDGYFFVKKGGFFEITKERTENEIILIIGVKPQMPDDYHVLKIDTQFEKAVVNIEQCLLKGSLSNQIKDYKDLLL